MNGSCVFQIGRQIVGRSLLPPAIILGLLVVGVAADAHATSDEHAAESHDAHGGHGPEIGHNIPAGVAAKDEPDLILLGKQAIDGDCNQTGQMLAGLMGYPQATFASKIVIADDRY